MSGLDSRSAWHRRQEQVWFHIHVHMQMCFQTLDLGVQLNSLRFYLLISPTAEKPYFVPKVMKCPSPKESFLSFLLSCNFPNLKKLNYEPVTPAPLFFGQ